MERDQEKRVDPLDTKKINLSVVPPASIIHEAMAMMDGAKKRSPYNWRENKVYVMGTIAKVLRHLYEFVDGEDHSSDTNPPVHHLAHAKADIGVLLDAIETGNAVDDRPPKGAAARMLMPTQCVPAITSQHDGVARALDKRASNRFVD